MFDTVAFNVFLPFILAIQHKEQNWYTYLIRNLTGAKKASENLFLKVIIITVFYCYFIVFVLICYVAPLHGGKVEILSGWKTCSNIVRMFDVFLKVPTSIFTWQIIKDLSGNLVIVYSIHCFRCN